MTTRRTVGLACTVFAIAAPLQADVLWDNGPPDGSNAYENGTENVYGGRRALLDDFTLDGDSVLQDFHWEHFWNTLPPGSGTGMELLFRSDAGGAPGNVIATANITSYSEMATGQTYFARPGAVSWVTFDDIALDAGTYWFEAAIFGPEHDHWLVHTALTGSECWVNYDDFGGLQPGSNVYGVPADLNFVITGNVIPVDCAADVTGDGVVDFADLLAILAAWGPCGDICPEDVDRNRVVDFGDLLIVLAAWGPCE